MQTAVRLVSSPPSNSPRPAEPRDLGEWVSIVLGNLMIDLSLFFFVEWILFLPPNFTAVDVNCPVFASIYSGDEGGSRSLEASDQSPHEASTRTDTGRGRRGRRGLWTGRGRWGSMEETAKTAARIIGGAVGARTGLLAAKVWKNISLCTPPILETLFILFRLHSLTFETALKLTHCTN